ncbi:hypothetical protein DFP72DRAFT_1062463 [Ephemerocybe angulata]|uniref:Protein kinase domain-containing protein n=1 Tax=Ephemerocybe angulata TaxID=980116 RepID=A0A8H6IAA1_9AGAR|nr:hypothetical protein DFP72DRAFT_1062463 [Tulosesus angulatus]
MAPANLPDVDEGEDAECEYFSIDMTENDIKYGEDPNSVDDLWLESQGLFGSVSKTPDNPTTAPDSPTTPGNPTAPGSPTTPGNSTTPVNPTTPDNPTTPRRPPQESQDRPAKENNTSTPFRLSSQNRLSSSEEVRKIILEELGKKLYFVTHWAQILYRKEAPLEKIVKFLNKPATGYHHGRWNTLPKVAKLEQEIYAPLVDIISLIIQEFNPASVDGVSREAIDTSCVVFQHKDAKHGGTLPDISIKATGPSFEGLAENSGSPSQIALGVGWSNVSAVLEVKREKVKDQMTVIAKQVALYCRQMFMHQPNRNFVRAAIVTERSVCFVHFDRSGLYLTPYIDIHDDPYTFVRLIVGLTACNEAVLGFDTTVQWVVDQQTGRRISGTVESYDEKTMTKTCYDLCMTSDPFIRPSIRGRGTTCYHAIHPVTKQAVVIKDSWRTKSRTPEIEFLEAAKGEDGVVQYLEYQDNFAETSMFRPRNAAAAHEDFHNRVKSRIVTESYNGLLNTFTGRYQLLSAFRDSLLGHQRLLLKGILHRDISINNVLLGLPGARSGCRGIIIDLDMAVWLLENVPKPNKDYRTGFQRYQSIATLYSRLNNRATVHTFLDDLESLFYLLIEILCMYKRPGVLVKDGQRPVDDALRDFEDSKLSSAIHAKMTLLAWPLDSVTSWWGEECDELLEAYQALILKVTRAQEKLRKSVKISDEEKYERLKAIGAVEKSGAYYQKLKDAFDKALAAIEDDEEHGKQTTLEDFEVTDSDDDLLDNPSSPCPSERAARRPGPSASFTTPGRKSNLKRPSESLHSDVAHVKRTIKNVRVLQVSEDEKQCEPDYEDEN